MKFDYYTPIYSIERDDIKLAEVFQRSHFGELNRHEIIEEIISSSESSSADVVIDGDYDAFWESAERSSDLKIHFKASLTLSDIEIFPKDNLLDFPSLEFFYSDDGVSWSQIESIRKGTNGFSFLNIRAEWLKINCGVKGFGIREILFYGI